MDISELTIPGAFVIKPRKVFDERGYVYDSLRPDTLAEVTGHAFMPAQITNTVSRRGVLRGIHGVTIPPGQAKFVTCLRGAAVDVVVDLRRGSPTFGVVDMTQLDARTGSSVYIAEGLGHATLAMSEDTCINYAFSTPYVPGTTFDINPFDPDLDISWALKEELITSPRATAAPMLCEAVRLGMLPTYEECLEHYDQLRTAAGLAV